MSRIFATVYEEKDYSIFKKLENNRDVSSLRFEKLKASFSEKEILNPIIVNEKMEIIDGQGRFEALKALNRPIKYVIAQGSTIDDCQRMNRYNTKWNLSDFVKSYANSGNKNYILLLDAAKEIKSSITRVLCLSRKNEKTGGICGSSLEDGSFIFTKADRDSAIKKNQLIKEILNALAYEFRINRATIIALSIIFDNPLYDHDRMIKKCEQCRSSYAQMAAQKDVALEFSRIYNYRSTPSKRVFFEDYYRQSPQYHLSKEYEHNWEDDDISTLK